MGRGLAPLLLLSFHLPLRVELEHTLLHAQVHQVGIDLAAGFESQVQLNFYS
jgi:hypothetical protein